MRSDQTYRIIISGGGTGGHIYPAISIAQALQAELADPDILFVGAKGKMEMKKVPEAGYKIVGLWISGLQRKLSLQLLLFPFKVVFSLINALKLIRTFKPDVVVGVGGYASGPLLRAATIKKIPTLIQEQNSYAGLTNKLLAKKVKRICVAHEGMEKYFPAEKLVVTGNPVRDGLVLDPAKREEAFQFFDLDPSKRTILMTGGSLGARTLNEAMLASIERFVENDIQVLWQTGGFYYEEMLRRIEGIKLNGVKMFDFLREMDKAYAVADIVVARAGALSIAELELTAKATILIPSPNVAEDHQTKNAMALVEGQAAVMIKDSNAVERLAEEVISLLENTGRIKELETRIAALAQPEAARKIANEVIKLAS